MNYKNKYFKYLYKLNLSQKGGLTKNMIKEINSRNNPTKPKEGIEVLESDITAKKLMRIQDLEKIDSRNGIDKILDTNLGKNTKNTQKIINQVLDINQQNISILDEKDTENQSYFIKNVGNGSSIDTNVFDVDILKNGIITYEGKT